MTGVEVEVRDTDSGKQEERLQAVAIAIASPAETAINDELLAGIEAAVNSDSDASEPHTSEVTEVTFATQNSPPRGTIVAPARPFTPTRKRTFTLVGRTPDKPRAVPSSPSTTIISEALRRHQSPPDPQQIPVSTAPARLVGKQQWEGKNSAYKRAIATERGRGRGGRGRA